MKPLDEIRPGMTREHLLTVEEEHAVSPGRHSGVEHAHDDPVHGAQFSQSDSPLAAC